MIFLEIVIIDEMLPKWASILINFWYKYSSSFQEYMIVNQRIRNILMFLVGSSFNIDMIDVDCDGYWVLFFWDYRDHLER